MIENQILSVQGLCKKYPSFSLKEVCFDLAPGKITGFIGRNGAGKSTTLKSLLHLVHPDAGSIRFFGMDFSGHEREIRSKIGFVTGGVNFYSNKKLKTISKVTKAFYSEWDEESYSRYMRMFELDENKTPAELSAGMQVKYALVLALSHHAELLILDEPTSGLDPISRDDLLDVFLELSEQGKSILFSTHITTDLERCADEIIYIRKGEIQGAGELKRFTGTWKAVEYPQGALSAEQEALLVGVKRAKEGFCALLKTENANKIPCEYQKEADLETIMIHLEKEGKEC